MLEDEEQDREKETEQEKPISKRGKLVSRIISIFLVFCFLILLIIYKSNHPEFPFSSIIILIVIILVVGLIVFFFPKIWRKIRGLSEKDEEAEEEKVPKEGSMEQIYEEIERFANSRMNHIKRPEGISMKRPYSIGRNSIYCFDVKFLYKDTELGTNEAMIVINANYLGKKPIALVSSKTSMGIINRIADGLSTNPQGEPDTEVTEEENPMLGISRKTTRKTHKKSQGKNKKQREELS